jgi:hypothetical protein
LVPNVQVAANRRQFGITFPQPGKSLWEALSGASGPEWNGFLLSRRKDVPATTSISLAEVVMIGDSFRHEPVLLVEQCLTGDATALHLLIEEYGGAAAESLCLLAGQRGFGPANLVDDAIQNLWLALLENGCQSLTGYDSTKGQLETYLAVLAWNLLRRGLRTGGRRGTRNAGDEE